MDQDAIKRYFTEDAREWIEGGYSALDGYNYPTAAHRLREVRKTLSDRGVGLSIVDLGCGGGNLAATLAADGHTVLGIDQSPDMVEIATRHAEEAGEAVTARCRFTVSPIGDYAADEPVFDAATSMGVIGYLQDDATMFEQVDRLLRPGGLFLLSCRNRLFNMVSLSFRTLEEIRSGEALDLLAEIEALYQPLPEAGSGQFVATLEAVSAEIARRWREEPIRPKAASDQHKRDGDEMPVEPRQHTPNGLRATADRHGFDTLGMIGIHPHLMDPRLNRLLPPGVFNALSNALEPFAREPAALVWSSVFIAVLEKRR